MKRLLVMLVVITAAQFVDAKVFKIRADTQYPETALQPMTWLEGASVRLRVYEYENGVLNTNIASDSAILYYWTNITSAAYVIKTNDSISAASGYFQFDIAPTHTATNGTFAYTVLLRDSADAAYYAGTGTLTIVESTVPGTSTLVDLRTPVAISAYTWTGTFPLANLAGITSNEMAAGTVAAFLADSNTTDHSALDNLAWADSGHTGTPARLAGFFEGGAAGYAGMGAGVYMDGSDNIAVSHDIISGAALGSTALQPAATNGLPERITAVEGDTNEAHAAYGWGDWGPSNAQQQAEIDAGLGTAAFTDSTAYDAAGTAASATGGLDNVAHTGEQDTLQTVADRGATSTNNVELLGRLLIVGTKGTITTDGKAGQMNTGYNTGTRNSTNEGARNDGYNETGTQTASGYGARNDGYNFTGTQTASAEGARNDGYNYGGTQTASGDGSMTDGSLGFGQYLSASGEGAWAIGANNSNTHDFAYCFGVGVNSTETNAIHARKFIGLGTGLSNIGTGNMSEAAHAAYLGGGSGGDWWTNPPTSLVTAPTNDWSAGTGIMSSDGTNLYWGMPTASATNAAVGDFSLGTNKLTAGAHAIYAADLTNDAIASVADVTNAVAGGAGYIPTNALTAAAHALYIADLTNDAIANVTDVTNAVANAAGFIPTNAMTAEAHAAYANTIQHTPIELACAATITVSEASGPLFRLELTNSATLITSGVDTNTTAGWKLDVLLGEYSLTLSTNHFTNRVESGYLALTNQYQTIWGNRPYHGTITEAY